MIFRSKIRKKYLEAVGWYGAMAILVAYMLVSFKVLAPDGFWYQFLNITGAGGMIFHSIIKKDYQPAVLNAVWVVVAFIALLKIFIRYA